MTKEIEVVETIELFGKTYKAEEIKHMLEVAEGMRVILPMAGTGTPPDKK